jgi:SAM-dependent methyltransferase
MMVATKRSTLSLFTFVAGTGSCHFGQCQHIKGVSAFSPSLNRIARFRYPISNVKMSSMISKVLENPNWPKKWPYTEQDFKRMDETDDGLFYSEPRLVYHIDEPCRKALTQYFSEVFEPNHDVLDLCSSWVCHYPMDWKPGYVFGLGMNAAELRQNRWLDEYVVRDLNENPILPFEPEVFDIVTCSVSFDYFSKPLEIMTEIGRVLRPGGIAIIAISNRCFPTKAFQIWLQTNDLEHVYIIGSFFHYSELFEPPTSLDRSPNPGKSDPLYIVRAVRRMWV